MKSELCLGMIRDILYAVNSLLSYYILNCSFHLSANYPSSGSAVTSQLACLSGDRAVLVRALAGDIVLCSWARHFNLTVPLSTQVYKWVQAILIQDERG